MDDKDRDDFWDIEFTRPARKPRRFSRDTGTVRLEISDSDTPEDTCGALPRPAGQAAQTDTAGARIPPRPAGQAMRADTPGARIPPRHTGTGSPAYRFRQGASKPTLDDLLRDGLVMHGSALGVPVDSEQTEAQNNFPLTAAERYAAGKGAIPPAGSHNQADGEPPVAAPPGMSAWDSRSSDGKIPERAAPSKPVEPYLCYKPDDNKLIHDVRVAMWPSPYTFYERFRSDARRYHNHPAHKCEPAPFFSFMPQYSQLNTDQRAWYFYWRSLVREGKYPSTDFGYVMLYIYELINLSDMLKPEAVLKLLCDVWLGYRAQHPRLDRYLSEWVCDLCLIHRLPLPYERLAPIYPHIIAAARFKEFYAGCVKGSDSPFAEALFNFNSGYDWRRSKYITKENRHLFEEHIRGAFMYACKKLESAPGGSETMIAKTDLLSSALRSYGARLKVIRDAYSGALCSYEVKRRVEVYYSCCTRSPELRFIVTDMVKYAENNIRALIGVKSRFKTPNLPQPARVLISEYFAPLRAKPGKQSDPPEYERFYEAASTSLSPEAALELERSSWETTSLLVNAFSGPQDSTLPGDNASESAGSTPDDFYGNADGISDDTDSTVTANDPQVDAAAAGIDSGTARKTGAAAHGEFESSAPLTGQNSGVTRDAGEYAVSAGGSDPDFEICARAYRLIRSGDSHGFSALAEELNIMPETLTEKLNEYAYEIIGDIAAEPDGSGWRIVDDYAADLDEYFSCEP